MVIFCINTAFGSLPAYLPTILQAMDHISSHTQGFSASPFLTAYVVCLTVSFIFDRFKRRGVVVVFFFCCGAAGHVILAAVQTTGVRYFATSLVCAGFITAVALTFTRVKDNQGSASKCGPGLAIFDMVGQQPNPWAASVFQDRPVVVLQRHVDLNLQQRKNCHDCSFSLRHI